MDSHGKDNLRQLLQDKVLKRFSVLWGDIGYEDTKLRVNVEFDEDLDKIVDHALEIFIEGEVGQNFARQVRIEEMKDIENGLDEFFKF